MSFCSNQSALTGIKNLNSSSLADGKTAYRFDISNTSPGGYTRQTDRQTDRHALARQGSKNTKAREKKSGDQENPLDFNIPGLQKGPFSCTEIEKYGPVQSCVV